MRHGKQASLLRGNGAPLDGKACQIMEDLKFGCGRDRRLLQAWRRSVNDTSAMVKSLVEPIAQEVLRHPSAGWRMTTDRLRVVRKAKSCLQVAGHDTEGVSSGCSFSESPYLAQSRSARPLRVRLQIVRLQRGRLERIQRALRVGHGGALLRVEQHLEVRVAQSISCAAALARIALQKPPAEAHTAARVPRHGLQEPGRRHPRSGGRLRSPRGDPLWNVRKLSEEHEVRRHAVRVDVGGEAVLRRQHLG
mmetsp:Transcript_122616/g.329416  ORF Transcript_122616/g.329416 Transcript_122616/m.329416 type:complete len:249 (-) Transcript_122616:771-1517(-)